MCSFGKLKLCGCDMSWRGKVRNWEWGGCSYNVDFGEYFLKKFLDLKEKCLKDIYVKINLYNN